MKFNHFQDEYGRRYKGKYPKLDLIVKNNDDYVASKQLELAVRGPIGTKMYKKEWMIYLKFNDRTE